jgi:hypothetical protein
MSKIVYCPYSNVLKGLFLSQIRSVCPGHYLPIDPLPLSEAEGIPSHLFILPLKIPPGLVVPKLPVYAVQPSHAPRGFLYSPSLHPHNVPP